jgi:hypothetical protein
MAPSHEVTPLVLAPQQRDFPPIRRKLSYQQERAIQRPSHLNNLLAPWGDTPIEMTHSQKVITSHTTPRAIMGKESVINLTSPRWSLPTPLSYLDERQKETWLRGSFRRRSTAPRRWKSLPYPNMYCACRSLRSTYS